MNTLEYIDSLNGKVSHLEFGIEAIKDRISALENPTPIIDEYGIRDPLNEAKVCLHECRNILRKVRCLGHDAALLFKDMEESNSRVIKKLEEFAEYFGMKKTFNPRRELSKGLKFSESLNQEIEKRDDYFCTYEQADTGKTRKA